MKQADAISQTVPQWAIDAANELACMSGSTSERVAAAIISRHAPCMRVDETTHPILSAEIAELEANNARLREALSNVKRLEALRMNGGNVEILFASATGLAMAALAD